MKKLADIGIIGGSGFYDLTSQLKEIKVETPYGSPSEKIAIGKIGKLKVAFLPRHNKTHDIPPHKINYLANIWALHSLGIREIITATACGSLQANIRPGDFVVLDQFFDRTSNRQDTFHHGPISTHISAAYPYCKRLSKLAYKIGKNMGIRVHPHGTIVVINGPRFSTAAESEWFTKMGWDVVNMTQYPEVILARELEMCYCAIALVTDWDVGLVADKTVKPVAWVEIVKIFKKNTERVKNLFYAMLKTWPKSRECECGHALNGARL